MKIGNFLLHRSAFGLVWPLLSIFRTRIKTGHSIVRSGELVHVIWRTCCNSIRFGASFVHGCSCGNSSSGTLLNMEQACQKTWSAAQNANCLSKPSSSRVGDACTEHILIHQLHVLQGG